MPAVFPLPSLRGVLALLLWAAALGASAAPQTVHFASLDGRTELAGYLYLPEGSGRWPAVVMLHGRSGPYSTAARGRYDASTISQRHRQWGEFWAARGYAALLVDSFGPRGHAAGFARGSYDERPAAVNEQSVRPLDAYGAAAWLRSRADIDGTRIGLQGWSNGAMATLATLAVQPQQFSPPRPGMTAQTGFRAALALYPGCRAQSGSGWHPYAPITIMVAANDEEVSPLTCRRLAQAVQRDRQADAPDFEFVWYEGAQHAFDDPGKARQSVPANAAATRDAMRRAADWFGRFLGNAP